MKKENLYKILYIISIILLIVYIIILLLDYKNYNPYETSFPFYTTIIVRTVEFIVPSLLIFIVGVIIKKKK